MKLKIPFLNWNTGVSLPTRVVKNEEPWIRDHDHECKRMLMCSTGLPLQTRLHQYSACACKLCSNAGKLWRCLSAYQYLPPQKKLHQYFACELCGNTGRLWRCLAVPTSPNKAHQYSTGVCELCGNAGRLWCYLAVPTSSNKAHQYSAGACEPCGNVEKLWCCLSA